jgi:hypothetical protein
MVERTINMRILGIFTGLVVAAALGAWVTYNIDYNHFYPILKELVEKCGEPCL